MNKQELFELVKCIPQGRVTTYGALARGLGHNRGARQVGRLLHQNTSPLIVPCHRVVFKDGSLTPSFAFGSVQREWLEKEGIEFNGDKVDMEKFYFDIASIEG